MKKRAYALHWILPSEPLEVLEVLRRCGYRFAETKGWEIIKEIAILAGEDNGEQKLLDEIQKCNANDRPDTVIICQGRGLSKQTIATLHELGIALVHPSEHGDHTALLRQDVEPRGPCPAE